jgi:hypothetical protein
MVGRDFNRWISINWRLGMIGNVQLSAGDVCGDPTGLRVRVEDVDMYDYVHFSVVESSDAGDDQPKAGGMSHLAFVRRFTKVGQ